MTEYTPTTEQVRDGFAIDPVAEYNDPITNHTALGHRAFDRWLRAHDAEVAANALREAGHESDRARPMNPVGVRVWLHNIADRIEREATKHKPNPELGSSEGSDQ